MEIGFKHATEMNLGPQEQWVFDPAKDKQIKFEALTGELKKGGKLSGKVTGAIAGKKFNWDLQFDLVLPQRGAGQGLAAKRPRCAAAQARSPRSTAATRLPGSAVFARSASIARSSAVP